MKKRLLKVLKLLLVLIVLAGHVFYNIKSNSVYYATNMPHGEGKEPALVMLIDNLYWVYNPPLDDIVYDIDGGNSVKNGKNSRISTSVDNKYIYVMDGISYLLDKDFVMLNATRMGAMEPVDINQIDQEKIVSEIKELVKPVIDAQTKPLINLQWLFNMLYQDEFK